MSSLRSPASSTRSSLDQGLASANPTSSSALASAAARAEAREARRKRSALRDYYNLASSTSASSSATAITAVPPNASSLDEPISNVASSHETAQLDPLDDQDFAPSTYVDNLLSKASLTDVLRVQVALAQETRGLDGERKGLVYDNYGRLIGARDVVQGVGKYLLPSEADAVPSANLANGKESMDRVKSSVTHLGPMVEALTAIPAPGDSARRHSRADEEKMRQQRSTVNWVLAAPARVQELLRNNRLSEAEMLQAEAEALLASWHGVDGVDEIRTKLTVAAQMAGQQTAGAA